MQQHRAHPLTGAVLFSLGILAIAPYAWAQEPVTSRLKLAIGGYIKPEFIYKTNDGGVGLAGAIPGAQNFGFAVVPQHNTLAGDNGRFVAAANESRFHFTITAPDWRGLKPVGYLEMDFEGDTASTIERFCQERDGNINAGSPCVRQQSAGNAAGSINNGGFRIRHAFLRLSGEGMGGSWNVLFGQTWNLFGLIPHYLGSSVSFGGSGILAGRATQLRFQHTWRFLRDFAWENSVDARADTTNLNEMPGFDGSTRLIYSGWQGWQGGARQALNLGFSATVQRQKADVETNLGASAVAGTATSGTKTLSNTAWGISGGMFLPILPGRSATDRTWALSALGEGGYGEGVNGLIPGTNPLPGGITIGANNRADAGAVYFHPGKCSGFFGPFAPSIAAGTAGQPFVPCGGPLGLQQTELSLIQSRWVHWNVQAYLPWNLWLSGGQKYIWYTNAQNAAFQTCVTNGVGGCFAALTPVNQGRSVDGPFPGLVNGAQIVNNASALFGGKDAVIKRQTYSFVAAFYDMTPNIRWGFEWGMHGTNRKDSAQDNQSHRWQFAAYYFF